MLPNLTRNEAVERAALVTVDNYRIDLDLTRGGQERSDRGKGSGDKVFGSVTTVTFAAADFDQARIEREERLDAVVDQLVDKHGRGAIGRGRRRREREQG